MPSHARRSLVGRVNPEAAAAAVRSARCSCVRCLVSSPPSLAASCRASLSCVFVCCARCVVWRALTGRCSRPVHKQSSAVQKKGRTRIETRLVPPSLPPPPSQQGQQRDIVGDGETGKQRVTRWTATTDKRDGACCAAQPDLCRRTPHRCSDPRARGESGWRNNRGTGWLAGCRCSGPAP